MSNRFLRSEMLIGAEAQKKLEQSHVAVFGLGGVGSWCAEALCRSGIGNITLIDQDIVGESNINRQLCATDATISMSKADAMKTRLADINPEANIEAITARYESSSRVEFFNTHYDYIVDCIDLVACKLDLIETSLNRGIPIVSALGTGNKFDAQMLQITDISKTEGCSLARVVRKELRRKGIKHLSVVYSPELAIHPADAEEPPPGRRSIPGSVVWVPATAGMLLCQHVVTELI